MNHYRKHTLALEAMTVLAWLAIMLLAPLGWGQDFATLDQLPTQRNARAQVVSVLTGTLQRDAALLANAAAVNTKWSLSAINTSTFGFFESPNSDNMIAVGAGGFVVTSINNPFAASDVGDYIDIAGAGVAGVTLRAKILVFTNAGQVSIDTAADTAVVPTKTSTVGHAIWGKLPGITVSTTPLRNTAGTQESSNGSLNFNGLTLTGIIPVANGGTGTNTNLVSAVMLPVTQNATVAGATSLLYASSPLNQRSQIINGCFRKWDYATSQTATGYGSANRWNNARVGTTNTTSQQSFVEGQTIVPGNYPYFIRHVVASVANAANYARMTQGIESVRPFAGKTVTISWYAKADAPKNIAISFTQDFGTGGAPSAQVTGIGAQLVNTGITWAKYTATISVPSIAGKTVGTTTDGCLFVNFWMDAGANFNAQTASLGQQSGTFEFSRVRIQEGTVDADSDVDCDVGVLDAVCARYAPIFDMSVVNGATNIGTIRTTAIGVVRFPFITTARIPPTGIVFSGTIGNLQLAVPGVVNSACTVSAFSSGSRTMGSVDFTGTATPYTIGQCCAVYATAGTPKVIFTGCEF